MRVSKGFGVKNILYIGECISDLSAMISSAGENDFNIVPCKTLDNLKEDLSNKNIGVILIDLHLFNQLKRTYLVSNSISELIPVLIILDEKHSLSDIDKSDVKNPLDFIQMPMDSQELAWRLNKSSYVHELIMTNHRQLEEIGAIHKELTKEHLMFFNIMSEMPVCLLVFDESFTLIYMNKEAELITGYAFETLQFKSLEQVYEKLELHEKFEDIVKFQGDKLCRDVLRNKYDREVHIERKGVDVIGDDEKIICRVDVFRDTTTDMELEALLDARIEERTQGVLVTQNITMMSLASLAESRDNETGMHLERMRNYSKLIAKDLFEHKVFEEIDEQFVEDMYSSSPLHDIGKVGIPDYVLLKPSKLTAEEWAIMKQHPTIGATTLNDAIEQGAHASFLKMARDICYAHHEKFDGSGYPRNLKGDDIPLSARIVSLADCYDALRAARVYKEAFSHEKSADIIRETADLFYDPRVVASFFRLEEKFIAIANEFAEAVDPRAGDGEYNQI